MKTPEELVLEEQKKIKTCLDQELQRAIEKGNVTSEGGELEIWSKELGNGAQAQTIEIVAEHLKKYGWHSIYTAKNVGLRKYHCFYIFPI